MKRNGLVLNKQYIKAGRKAVKWLQSETYEKRSMQEDINGALACRASLDFIGRYVTKRGHVLMAEVSEMVTMIATPCRSSLLSRLSWRYRVPFQQPKPRKHMKHLSPDDVFWHDSSYGHHSSYEA